MQIIPQSVSKLWSLLEIRALVLFSLGLQSILIFTGNMRKNSASKKISTLLWLTYLSAEWAVTVSLNQCAFQQCRKLCESRPCNYSILGSISSLAPWRPRHHYCILLGRQRVVAQACTNASHPSDYNCLCCTQVLDQYSIKFSCSSNLFCWDNQVWREDMGSEVCKQRTLQRVHDASKLSHVKEVSQLCVRFAIQCAC